MTNKTKIIALDSDKVDELVLTVIQNLDKVPESLLGLLCEEVCHEVNSR